MGGAVLGSGPDDADTQTTSDASQVFGAVAVFLSRRRRLQWTDIDVSELSGSTFSFSVKLLRRCAAVLMLTGDVRDMLQQTADVREKLFNLNVREQELSE